MKKLQISLVGAFLIASAFMSVQARNAYYESSTMPVLSASKKPVKELSTEVIMQTKAGARAIQDIGRRYKNIGDVKWFADNQIISASFNKDGAKVSVLYNKNGRWVRDQKNYEENKMPADVRELIKRSVYFDSKINYINEIHEGSDMFYIIYLEDQKAFSVVVVYDGEIELYEKIDKNM